MHVFFKLFDIKGSFKYSLVQVLFYILGAKIEKVSSAQVNINKQTINKEKQQSNTTNKQKI